VLPIFASIILFLLVWLVLNVSEPVVRGILPRIANFMTKYRYGDYLPVVLILVLGGGLAALAGDQFVDLSELVVSKSPVLQNIDQTFHDWAIYARTPGDTTFFALMTVIGGPVVMGLMTGLVAGALFFRKRRRWATYVIVTAGGGGLLNMELKRYFERARPALAEMLRRAHGYSFPSGHVLFFVTFFGFLLFLTVTLVKPSWWRTILLVVLGAMIALIGISRIYEGQHWASDVIGSYLLGSVWLALTVMVYNWGETRYFVKETVDREKSATQ